MDKVVLGFDTAGAIRHITRATAKSCQITAKQIRRYYASVRIVSNEMADSLLEKDREERNRQTRLCEAAMR